MPGLGMTPFVAFIGAAGLLVLLGLLTLSSVLTTRNAHRKRLARVSRHRMLGRLEFQDSRLNLTRAKEGKFGTPTLGAILAKAVPLLDAETLRANIERAEMRLSTGGFLFLSGGLTLALAVAGGLATGMSMLALAVPALFLAMALVDGFVRFRGGVVSNRFMKQLPDAIDTIIRGIRSGLPVVECIASAGQEMPAPLGPHFRAISERVQLGETLEGALWRVAEIIRQPEVDFFAVSISIQAETGGSLADALGNLADLLRKREHMKLKIKAISSEAKASAMIIGALPFGMLGLLTWMSPDYVRPLFTDPRGQIMLGCGLASILAGAVVMWRMTQFRI